MNEHVKILEEMIQIQGQHGNWNYNAYMHGMYNGMVYAHSIITGTEPKYKHAPRKWLVDRHTKRSPFLADELSE